MNLGRRTNIFSIGYCSNGENILLYYNNIVMSVAIDFSLFFFFVIHTLIDKMYLILHLILNIFDFKYI